MTNTVNQGAIQTTPVGDANRGLWAQWFHADDIAREDWLRDEQKTNNQFQRDLYFQELANSFNAKEAQKQRDYDMYMSNTQYSRAVADLKKAGLNPVLALGGSGASFHGGTSATSGGSRTSSGSSSRGFTDNSAVELIGSALNLAAGLVAKLPIKKFKVGF